MFEFNQIEKRKNFEVFQVLQVFTILSGQLALAVENNDIDKVERLLKEGAFVESTGIKHLTILPFQIYFSYFSSYYSSRWI
jgi:hypothetical protein